MTAPAAIPAWFRAALARYPRIAIAGGPRVGKSHLSSLVTDRHVLHTDDLIDVGWENIPIVVRRRLADHPSFIVEGVQVARCLRKDLRVDAVVWMSSPKVALTPGQASMSKAVLTVFQEWRSASAGRVPIIVEPRVAAGRAA